MSGSAAHARLLAPDAGLCRCVVWAHPGDQAMQGLIAGIQRRGAAASAAAGAAQVMVELAHGARVVIVHRPSDRSALDRLLAAVARYYPHVILWRFEPQGQGLVPFDRRPGTPSAPSSNGNGHHGRDVKRAPEPQPAPPSSEPLVTPDELAMLLGRD